MAKSISYERARKARLMAGAKILKEREKLVRVELKSKKYEDKKKEERKKKAWINKKTIKSKVKLPKYSAKKAILKDKTNYRLVQEGRTGYFNKEIMEETKWLS